MAAEAAPDRRRQTPRFTLRLSAGELAMLRERARHAGSTASETVRDALYLVGTLELRDPADRVRPRAKRRPATSDAG
jgi:hypothetical protein